MKKFSYNSRILKHLGEDLITSPEVAVIELIKNSFDAGSEMSKVHIFGALKNFSDGKFENKLDKGILKHVPEKYQDLPFIVFEDIGKGMNEKTIDEGFLNIGTDIKQKERGDTILLGEKGIGRLSTQKLGSFLLVETASAEESFINIFTIDWDELLDSKEFLEKEIPYYRVNKNGKLNEWRDSYTRIWIFDIRLQDYFSNFQQVSFFENEMPEMNPELKSAISFLISPFVESEKTIDFLYNSQQISSSFNKQVLSCYETKHYFYVSREDKAIFIDYGLELTPWFVQGCYIDEKNGKADPVECQDICNQLFIKHQERFNKSLKIKLPFDKVIDAIIELKYSLLPRKDRDREGTIVFWKDYINNNIMKMHDIIPIKGENYSYKRDYKIGKNIFEFAKSKNDVEKSFEFEDLREILKNNNGIKLYRGDYRIGFLGNKDSDWIYLQQYRTSGQQYYRINSANTIGYISVNDNDQKYIKEISSRLDITNNEIAELFKMLVTVVFNKYFYELNRRADKLIEAIFIEENIKDIPAKEKIKKNEKLLSEIIAQNKKVSKKIEKALNTLNQETLSSTDISGVRDTLENANEQIKRSQNVFADTESIIEESKLILKSAEVEAYNNYKLMANGLITETITHELHSICNSKTGENLEIEFKKIKEYLIKVNTQLYNTSFINLHDNYKVLFKKVEDISNLYSFVEKTFIRKGDLLYLFSEQLADTISVVEDKLKSDLKKNKIRIDKINLDFEWKAPKGVLLHVFYNLLSNSIYWIDYRKKHSNYDKKFFSDKEDVIVIEGNASKDTVFIYDTGTGVLDQMQFVLFQAFESGKGNDGRGMGLYIVKQLLNAFHSDIVLLDEKNEYGNRYKFAIQMNEEKNNGIFTSVSNS